MQGFPLIPRAEMSLWRAGRGAALILKDEWRLNQRSLSFSLPPPLLCLAPTAIYACEKPPDPPPTGGRMPGAFSHYPLQRYPLTLRRLLCLGYFVSGEHRCGCGQFGAGHECGAEGGELACVAFGYAEQGEQLGG